MRVLLIILGFVSLAVGLVGIFVPLLPTTPFVLLSAYLFSKSSKTFHRWLREHRHFGRSVREWEEHQVVPLKAKIFGTVLTSISMIGVPLLTAVPGWAMATVGTLFAIVLAFVWTRPSRPPLDAPPE